ncbi:MAG: histidine kinase [Gammaproteobacteria bacterium]|nr:histidine kinase [Gammaproteobacteria bacterium]
MRRLPFKYQILLGPAIIAITLAGLIWFTLSQFQQIQSQNETIRQWARITDRMHLAIVTGQRMVNLANSLIHNTQDQDELQFSYLEQSRIFSDNVLYPECFEKMNPEVRDLIKTSEQKVRYDEELNPKKVVGTLNILLPKLEQQYNTWWAQKRGAYIDYYDNVKIINYRLLNISLTVLVICLILAGSMTFWTLRNTNSRLRKLANDAQAVCDGTLNTVPSPDSIIDEIDRVTECAARMTHRLVKVVAVEKILQGAENERRRIAMDMHDQALADLTGITRKMDDIQASHKENRELHNELNGLASDLQTGIQSIREIIDDLHPHNLEILGIAAAVEELCKRACKSSNCPQFHLSLDSQIENSLSKLQCITLYRIIQELVQNIIKHANCSLYEISLRLEPGKLTLLVEDNGTGFDIDISTGKGHGLINIEERAKAINADFQWSSSRFNSGSRFELTINTNKDE